MNQPKDMEGAISEILNSKISKIRLYLDEFSLMIEPVLRGEQENFMISQLDDQVSANLSNINYIYRTLLLKINLMFKKMPLSSSSFDFDPKHANIGIGKFQNCPFKNENFAKNTKKKVITRQKNRGPYRSYTREEKNHIVNLHNMGMTFASISKQLKIPQKNVVRWCREGLTEVDSNKRIADSEMERKLSVWLQSHPARESLSYSDIQEKALELSSNSQFKASRGWLKNFLRRYDTKGNQLVVKNQQDSLIYQEE